MSSRAIWLDSIRREDLLTVLPPFPGQDGINRSTFVPVKVTLQNAYGASGVAIQFGYDTNFDCTSRNEACKAVSATINQTTAFYFASEAFAPLACSSGCTITIPALSQRVVYYRPKYFDGMGVLSTMVVVAP